MSLQNAILGLLTYQSMSGYDLKNVFDKSINFFWHAQLSQIYRELGTLESKGFASSHIEPQEVRPDRKVYSITREGERSFHEWLGKFPQKLLPPVRDEFNMRIFFGSALPREEIAFQLKRFIKEMKEELNFYRTVETIIEEYSKEVSRSGEKFYWGLTLKKGYFMAEAQICWAEECLRELKQKTEVEGC